MAGQVVKYFGRWKNNFGKWEHYIGRAGGKIILAGGKMILAGKVGKLFWKVWSPPDNPIESERAKRENS